MKSFAERATDVWAEDAEVREKYGSASLFFDAIGVAKFPNATIAFRDAVDHHIDRHNSTHGEATRAIANGMPALHRLYLDEQVGKPISRTESSQASLSPAALAFENAVDLYTKQKETTRGAAIRAIIETRADLHDAYLREIGA